MNRRLPSPDLCRFLCALLSAIAVLAITTAAIAAEAFPRPSNTEKSNEQPMSPEEVCKSAKLPPGFKLQVFAAEPDVQNPIAITTDARGRLWIAENYTWAGADADNFDTKLRDRIVILEDTDGDGHHDKRTVFYDRAVRLTSIEVGLGGVWLMCSPHLIFIPDHNRDDIPDGPPEIVLDGFDIASVSHTVANGLKWGPDGWLYGRQGILGTSRIGVPGTDDAKRVVFNTGVWRVHPTTHRCEAVMHGMTNPWGFDYDAYGEMFVINTVIGHLWHVLPGGRTERMFGTDFNPHAYQLLSQVADHVHWHTSEAWSDVDKGVTDRTSAAGGGHAHTGLMIYQGDNWPADYRGRVLTLNLHGRRLNTDTLVERPVGYTAKHDSDICFIADPFFRGMDIIAAQDGGAFIADWSDTGECHEIGGVHRSSGRIYKLTYGNTGPRKPIDLSEFGDVQLAQLQTYPNDWVSRHARQLLQERAVQGELHVDAVRSELLSMFSSDPNPVNRCREMWSLAITKCVDNEWLLERLRDKDEHIRVWAIRFLSDSLSTGETSDWKPLVEKLTKLAAEDPSGLVLLYIASTLQKLPTDARWSVANALSARMEPAFNTDRTLSIMLWLGIEPLVITDSTHAVAMLRDSTFPLVRENIARRISWEIEREMPLVEQLLSIANERADVAPSIIRGMAAALNGRKESPTPRNWSKVAEKLASNHDASTRDSLNAIGVVLRDPQTLSRLRKTISDTSIDAESRRRALELLVNAWNDELVVLLRQLISDRDLAATAIRGIARVDDAASADAIVAAFASLSADARIAAIDTLVSRASYALKLLQAIESKQIAASTLSAFQVRQINALNDAQLSQRVRKLWGDIRESPQDKRAEIDRLRHKFGGGDAQLGSIESGHALFEKTCATCHVLFGEGKNLGPDLTGSNRKNLDYLLENMIDPSAVVGVDFRSAMYYLVDGRAITGVVREQNDRTLTLATPEGLQTIDREEIDEVHESDQSIMPDGLLRGLSDAQIRDLLAYLMSN